MQETHVSVDEILEGMEYRVDRVWHEKSVATAEVLLLAAWLGLFLSISAVLSALMLAVDSKAASGHPNESGELTQSTAGPN